MLAKGANSVLLAALGAVGFVDTEAAASGGGDLCRVGHSVAERVFGDRCRKLLGGLELPCRRERCKVTTGDTMVRGANVLVGARRSPALWRAIRPRGQRPLPQSLCGHKRGSRAREVSFPWRMA
jgi:hypothetical protein